MALVDCFNLFILFIAIDVASEQQKLFWFKTRNSSTHFSGLNLNLQRKIESKWFRMWGNMRAMTAEGLSRHESSQQLWTWSVVVEVEEKISMPIHSRRALQSSEDSKLTVEPLKKVFLSRSGGSALLTSLMHCWHEEQTLIWAMNKLNTRQTFSGRNHEDGKTNPYNGRQLTDDNNFVLRCFDFNEWSVPAVDDTQKGRKRYERQRKSVASVQLRTCLDNQVVAFAPLVKFFFPIKTSSGSSFYASHEVVQQELCLQRLAHFAIYLTNFNLKFLHEWGIPEGRVQRKNDGMQ